MATRKRRRSTSLSGAKKLANTKASFVKEVAKPAGVIAGVIASSLASKALDKVDALKVDPTQKGFSVKKMAKPAILLAVGAGAVAMTNGKKDNGSQFVSGLGYGVAGGGLMVGAKQAMGKSLVDGLGDVEDVEMIEDMATLVAGTEDTFEPELIDLQGGHDDSADASDSETIAFVGSEANYDYENIL